MKVLGVIGGMGPLATCEFYRRLIEKTPARKDQEHIHVIIDSYPQIPDRTAYLVGAGENPLPYLIDSAQRLEKAGADVLCMPCNAAHAFFDDLSSSVGVPFLNMVELAVKFVSRFSKSAVVFATDGTLLSGVYQRAAERYGLALRELSRKWQRKLMDGIYDIKAGRLEEGIEKIEVVSRSIGEETILAACTEVSIALKGKRNVVDAMDALVEEAIRVCLS
ncbi:MAG TPA: aspartate racemase [Thermotogae bacterium]|nr:aspartate racemase [Thermotogota bacterium]